MKKVDGNVIHLLNGPDTSTREKTRKQFYTIFIQECKDNKLKKNYQLKIVEDSVKSQKSDENNKCFKNDENYS